MESSQSFGETIENGRIRTLKIAYHSLIFCIYSILRSKGNPKMHPRHSGVHSYGAYPLKLAKHKLRLKHSIIENTIYDWNLSNHRIFCPTLIPSPGLGTVPA